MHKTHKSCQHSLSNVKKNFVSCVHSAYRNLATCISVPMLSSHNMVDGYSYSATLKIWLTNAIYTGVTLITGFLTLLFVYQDKLLYFPSIPGAPKLTKDNPSGPIMLSLTTLFFIKVCVGYRHPREYDIEHEDVMIPTEDGIRIHVWLLKQSNSLGYPTNIFFHGNSGSKRLKE